MDEDVRLRHGNASNELAPKQVLGSLLSCLLPQQTKSLARRVTDYNVRRRKLRNFSNIDTERFAGEVRTIGVDGIGIVVDR